MSEDEKTIETEQEVNLRLARVWARPLASILLCAREGLLTLSKSYQTNEDECPLCGHDGMHHDELSRIVVGPCRLAWTCPFCGITSLL